MRWFRLLAAVGLVSVITIVSLRAGYDEEVEARASVAPPVPQKLVVKIYPVADLVAPTRPRTDSSGRSTLSGWSAGLKEELKENLEELRSVLQVADPDEGQIGQSVIHPASLSLIVRETPEGHQAIADLLKQLRETRDVEIELQVTLASLDPNKQQEGYLRCLKMLDQNLTAEQVGEFRKLFEESNTVSGSVRVPNGRTVVAGGPIGQFMTRFTAVANADHSAVEVRADSINDDIRDGQFPWMSQSHTISLGKSVAFSLHCDGATCYLLVTPRLVDTNPVAH